MQINKNRDTTKIWLVIGSAIAITLLLGLPRLNMMSRLDKAGLADFETHDYVRRLVIIFFTAILFLGLNILVDRLNVFGRTFNFKKAVDIATVNLLVFVPLQYFVLTELAQKIEHEVNESAGAFYGWTVAINVVLVSVCVLVGIAYRNMRENQTMQVANEALQRETADARFAQLREQVNPHFMFNAFATLEGLIDESPERSKKFLYNLSELYRYVLRSERDHTVSLSEELRYVHTYNELLAERFGLGILIQVKIESSLMERKILPMALQTLLENAIKHNGFEVHKPLIIRIIDNQEDYIEVSNNLAPRTSIKNSQSIGLLNLNQRYKFVSKQEIVITKTATEFCVKLPLLT
jgi:Histidine kinase